MCVLSTYHEHAWRLKRTQEEPGPLEPGYGWLLATVQVLGASLRPSARATSALNYEPRKTEPAVALAGAWFTAGRGALTVLRPNLLPRQLLQRGLWSCSAEDPVHCHLLTPATGPWCFPLKTA